jgi:hypothetical protein
MKSLITFVAGVALATAVCAYTGLHVERVPYPRMEDLMAMADFRREEEMRGSQPTVH